MELVSTPLYLVFFLTLVQVALDIFDPQGFLGLPAGDPKFYLLFGFPFNLLIDVLFI